MIPETIPTQLRKFLTTHGKICIAFSGGSDSAYLFYALAACGSDFRAYYVQTAFQPAFERADAERLARELGKELTVITADALRDERVRENPSNRCYFCKQNKQIHCEDIQVIGNTRNGAFAEYTTAPERCCFLAQGIDMVHASMAEPLGCCINAHNKAAVPLGGNVLINGAGTIGLMHMYLCKRRGASKVTMIDLKEDQLKKAAELGADEVLVSDSDVYKKLKEKNPKGFDFIIDATGVPKVIENTIPLLAECGTYIFFGVCPTISEIKVNPFDIYYHDWKLIGSYALQKTIPQSIAMIKSGLNMEDLIGQVITLDDMPRVFDDFVNGRTNNKIIVKNY